ncbi:MAG TPA: Na(+)/H(+) antiporter subunit C [Actinoplanes sp.]|nr:Na(+)/H(+) antiporter subunit C [Actinoplanes sp.]
MRPSIVLLIAVGVLFAAGTTLLLERTLTRVLLGVMLLGNGANLLVLASAEPGAPPIVGTADTAAMTDPLPQAMILTAIVITLGMTAFLLAVAYRSWRLSGHDEVQDDAEDRRVRELAERDEGSDAEELDADDLDAETIEEVRR